MAMPRVQCWDRTTCQQGLLSIKSLAVSSSPQSKSSMRSCRGRCDPVGHASLPSSPYSFRPTTTLFLDRCSGCQSVGTAHFTAPEAPG